jgi:hypothetical protein
MAIFHIVMPALVAGIHVFLNGSAASKTWMAGTSQAMTIRDKSACWLRRRFASRAAYGLS